MKLWQKVLLIIGIIFSVLAFIANIVLSAVFPNCGANIFTAIGGWVSGIATLMVGVIAYFQNYYFSKSSTRHSLINQITTYMSDFQIGYVNYVRIDRIIDMCYRIRDCSIEKNPRIKDNMQFDINDDLIFFERNLLQFEAVLMKSIYSSSNIIALHKKLKEMEKKFDDFGLDDLDEQFEERYYFKECQKRIKFVQQWMKEIDVLSNKIMLDFQTLRSKLLTCKANENFMEDINCEEAIITAYFQELNNTQIKEQNNG